MHPFEEALAPGRRFQRLLSLSSTSRARDLIKAQLRPFRDSVLTLGCVVRQTLKLERQRPLLTKQGMFR